MLHGPGAANECTATFSRAAFLIPEKDGAPKQRDGVVGFILVKQQTISRISWRAASNW